MWRNVLEIITASNEHNKEHTALMSDEEGNEKGKWRRQGNEE